MLSLDEDLNGVVIADGVEIELPTATAVPLAFIASELLTNAAKYGEGQIGVRLESGPEKGYLLSSLTKDQHCRMGITQPAVRGSE